MDVNVNNYNNYAKIYTEPMNSTYSDKMKDNNTFNNSNEGTFEEKKYTEKDLEKAVKKLNKFLEDDNAHAEVSRHKELGTLMVKIVSGIDDKVLLEAPSEKVLDMVASLCKSAGILDEKA